MAWVLKGAGICPGMQGAESSNPRQASPVSRENPACPGALSRDPAHTGLPLAVHGR